MERKSRARGESAVFLLVFAAILVAVNVLSVKWFARADLTARKVHSLSRASLEVVGRLKDALVVKAYFTEDLPPPFNAHARYVRDILTEYQAYSHGRMRFEFIDPKEDEEKNETAKQLGIEKVRHRVIEKEGQSFRDGYRGLAFTYMGTTKAIPVIQDTSGLEYEITSILKQLIKDRASVAFVTGHGEPDFEPPEQQDPNQPRPPLVKMLREFLENTYNVRAVALKGQGKIPQKVRSIVMLGPRQRLEDEELFKLDQFLMGGGSIAVFADGMQVATGGQQLTAEANDTGLNDWLGAYGVKINQDMVFDAQCGRIPARPPGGIPIPIVVPFPPWPRLASLASEHPVAFRLSNLILGFASSLKISPELRSSKKLKLTVLGRSSDQSWRETTGVDMDPFQEWKLGKNRGPFTLAVAVEGRFRSAWAGRPAPNADVENNESATPAVEVVEESQKPGRLIVVGDSDMLQDQVLGLLQRMQGTEQPSNLVFGANAVDWLTQEQGLIAVRAKNVEDPDLKEIDDGKKVLYKWGNIFAWPILFAAYGFVRAGLRRKRRANVTL